VEPYAAALEVLQSPQWGRDPAADDALRFLKTADAGALKRLRTARPGWRPGLLEALARTVQDNLEEADRRALRVLAAVLPAAELAAWAKEQPRPAFRAAWVCLGLLMCAGPAYRDAALTAARALFDSLEGYGPDQFIEVLGRNLLPNVIDGLRRGR